MELIEGDTYVQERRLLRQLFPRGRCRKDEDGSCLLRARRKARSRDFVYVQSPLKLIGVYYSGNGRVYRKTLGRLIVGDYPCDGEGLLYVKWDPQVAKKLAWFSRGRHKSNLPHVVLAKHR